VSSARGFTLAEVMVTLAVFMTASAIAVPPLWSAVTAYRADGQAQRLVGLLQLGRETAITRQRDVQLLLEPAARRARLVLRDGGNETVIREVALEDGVEFRQFPGFGDTPAAFGAAAPIDFNGADPLLFISDGTLVDDTDLPINGTIFLGIAGRPASARALAINGATARAQLYARSSAWMAR
jgi:prepilin-type N-terminal cleavage/methylation domain-containing protein